MRIKGLKIIYAMLALFFSISAISIYQFVAKPLIPEEITEVDKRLYFDYIVNRATEYDSDLKPFWWLEMGENSLSFLNVGDETIVGKVSFKLTQNPCQFTRFFEVIFLDKKETKYISGLKAEIIYNFDIRLEPYQRRELKIISTNGEDCKLENGDKRNFLFKLSEVRFD